MNQREKLNKFRGRNNHEDIIFYSFKKSEIEHINTHELHRLEHSIKSIREFNNEISVYLFCDDPNRTLVVGLCICIAFGKII